MDKKILKLLICPHSGEKLFLMNEDSLEEINHEIKAGKVKSLSGVIEEEGLQQILCNKSKTYFYPVKNGIPLLDKTKAINIRKEK
ncbi:MAG: hypothetical protein P8M55_05975 [Gammaproteobacteria bacterium]|jgi:uncharacterized protein YbaR (Trm112 family)|nr:hypothetical protein [Gammaproteobacteria bacterium]MDG2435163.1 hypothetical protein [Gammaproteobacteria bacterium]